MNEQNSPIKIRSISISNYKGIDKLDLDFPAPRMPDDPDIIVMGSRNGLGKTSVIECCSFLLLGSMLGDMELDLRQGTTLNVPDLLIKAGSEFACITGRVVRGDRHSSVRVTIMRNEKFKTEKVIGQAELENHAGLRSSGTGIREQAEGANPFGFGFANSIDILKNEEHRDTIDKFIRDLCVPTPNPMIRSSFLLFHSYRKVQEGNPELNSMINQDKGVVTPWNPLPRKIPMSEFKVRMLRSLMSQAGLFDLPEGSQKNEESSEAIDKLNTLMEHYAGGRIAKLRPSEDNTIDFRIMPKDGHGTFTFDGLSSGQKEIISTLFLIWRHTIHKPCVVFIDEPELHLNPEWQRTFTDQLSNLAPENQYIIATHSEDIMDTVDDDRRFLLVGKKGESQ